MKEGQSSKHPASSHDRRQNRQYTWKQKREAVQRRATSPQRMFKRHGGHVPWLKCVFAHTQLCTVSVYPTATRLLGVSLDAIPSTVHPLTLSLRKLDLSPLVFVYPFLVSSIATQVKTPCDCPSFALRLLSQIFALVAPPLLPLGFSGSLYFLCPWHFSRHLPERPSSSYATHYSLAASYEKRHLSCLRP